MLTLCKELLTPKITNQTWPALIELAKHDFGTGRETETHSGEAFRLSVPTSQTSHHSQQLHRRREPKTSKSNISLVEKNRQAFSTPLRLPWLLGWLPRSDSEIPTRQTHFSTFPTVHGHEQHTPVSGTSPCFLLVLSPLDFSASGVGRTKT